MAKTEGGWLQGKRVLVSRPAAQAEGLARAIAAEGGLAIKCPVLNIEPVIETPLDRQRVVNLDGYEGVIVVSRNAATLGLARIDRFWPQLPAHLRWFAVGKSTATCLKGDGIKPLVPDSGFNSEALLAMSELSASAAAKLHQPKLLILKGEGGRELLEEQLTERGFSVDALPLYRRTTSCYTPQQIANLLADGPPDALVATSVDILMAMDSLFQEAISNRFELPLVVASERIAVAAKELGYQRIISAASASDESITQALNVIAL